MPLIVSVVVVLGEVVEDELEVDFLHALAQITTPTTAAAAARRLVTSAAPGS
jgi:hypothetical protein